MGKALQVTRLEQLAGLGAPSANQVPTWNGSAYVPLSLQGTGGGTVRTFSLDPNASLIFSSTGNNTAGLTLVLLPTRYTVANLPAQGVYAQVMLASNGRKAGEGAGLGTGTPVWWDGNNWRTFYDNSIVQA